MFFKRLKRYEHDQRIAVVDSIDHIPSCGRIFSRVNGVLCPYDPFTKAEEREVIDFMRDIMTKHKKYEIFDDTSAPFYKAEYGFSVPVPLKRVLTELQDIFSRSTGIHGRSFIRANSSHPKKPHQHDTTLTSTLTGLGTIGYRMDGTSYQIPNKHIFIFDKQIPHMASQTFPESHPKLTVIVG